MDVALFFAVLAASFLLNGIEAAWGREKLVDYMRRQGWTLRSIRWQPRWPTRQGKFHIEVERDGKLEAGTAFVGGQWVGPVWSRSISVEWDSGGRDRQNWAG